MRVNNVSFGNIYRVKGSDRLVQIAKDGLTGYGSRQDRYLGETLIKLEGLKKGQNLSEDKISTHIVPGKLSLILTQEDSNKFKKLQGDRQSGEKNAADFQRDLDSLVAEAEKSGNCHTISMEVDI